MRRLTPGIGLCPGLFAGLFAGLFLGLGIVTLGCGDDTSAASGSGGSSTTAGPSGDGGSGPTTTGAGGIADDGTEATVEECNAFFDETVVVSTDLGCAIVDDDEHCGESAPSWVPCVAQWNAYYACADAATTVDLCACADATEGDGGILCDWETSCADELDALDACGA